MDMVYAAVLDVELHLVIILSLSFPKKSEGDGGGFL